MKMPTLVSSSTLRIKGAILIWFLRKILFDRSFYILQLSYVHILLKSCHHPYLPILTSMHTEGMKITRYHYWYKYKLPTGQTCPGLKYSSQPGSSLSSPAQKSCLVPSVPILTVLIWAVVSEMMMIPNILLYFVIFTLTVQVQTQVGWMDSKVS